MKNFKSTLVLALGLIAFNGFAANVALADDNGNNDSNKSLAANLSDTTNDTAITTKVKAQILAAKLSNDKSTKKAFKDSNISVTTTNGKVDLSGCVTSHAAKKSASEIAKQVQGVTLINNNIHVDKNNNCKDKDNSKDNNQD